MKFLSMIPQILMLLLISINLLTAAHLHGKPKEGNYSFWYSIINAIVLLALLYFGGFF